MVAYVLPDNIAREERPDFPLKDCDQVRLHKLILIWDVEHNDALAGEVLPKLLGDPVAVAGFHRVDGVCPFDKFWIKRYLRGVICACGCALDARELRKHFLSSGAAQAILTTDEEGTVHRLCGLTFELRRGRRQDARPGLAKMYRVPPDRAWWRAVGAPLERGVRQHFWRVLCRHRLDPGQ